MPDFSKVPEVMRPYRQWIVWRPEAREHGQKPTKVPYDPTSGAHADVMNPATWADYDTAVSRAVNGFGLGFVFTEQDPFFGIDLDVTTDQAEIEKQKFIVDKVQTYTEFSPSGRGLHLIGYGHVPHGRRRGAVEIYSSRRYFTMTGDVYRALPVTDCAGLAAHIWGTLGGQRQAGTEYSGMDQPETKTDREVYDLCCQTNADKFPYLWQGQWSESGYGSQSEADFALIDIIAYHSRNRDQIVRLFHMSGLGQRPKAYRVDYLERMVNRSFDNMLPPVEFEQLREAFRIFDEKMKTPATVVTVAGVSSPLERSAADEGLPTAEPYAQGGAFVKPPGLLGDLAEFMYWQAPRPFVEGATAAAIGVFSGLCGRAYNTPTGAGLNLYTVLIAETATGKEMINQGIGKFITSLRGIGEKLAVPAIADFFGPSLIRSDAGLVRALQKKPSMVSVLGEFGLFMSQVCAERANGNDTGIRRVLLDLYSKSGHGQVLQPMAYSDEAKNTEPLHSPSFSIVAETTPSTLYPMIDERMIEVGLLPRCFFVEYTGDRPPLNEHAADYMMPAPLHAGMAQLATLCLEGNQRQIATRLRYSPEAERLARQLDHGCDDLIRRTKTGLVRLLWSRAHLKAMKLASLAAVADNPFMPEIQVSHWKWAEQLVLQDVGGMIARFERGDIGAEDIGDKGQADLVLLTCRRFLSASPQELSRGWQGNPDRMAKMHADGVIPYAAIQNKLANVAAFRRDRQGGTAAIRRALGNLTASGVLQEIPKAEMATRYGHSVVAYAFVK